MTPNQIFRLVSQKSGLSDVVSNVDRTFLFLELVEAIRETMKSIGAPVSSKTVTISSGSDPEQAISGLMSPRPLRVFNIWVNPSENTDFTRLSRFEMGDVLERREIQIAGQPFQYATLADLLMFDTSPISDLVFRVLGIFDLTNTAPDDGAGDTDLTDASLGALPDDSHRCVEAYLMWKASEKLHNFDGVNYYKSLWSELCGSFRKDLRRMGGRLEAMPHVGYPDRPHRPANRNDTYPPR